MLNWTKKQAREFLVNYQMINTKNSIKGIEGISVIFDRLQSIQKDPLDVVGRNADLVLQARLDNYKKYEINDYLYKDRILFDGWDKMMAIYKTEDYPLFAHIREARSLSEINTLQHRLQIHALDYIDEILELITEGPKYSKDISLGGSKKHHWGQMKVSSAALDYLFFRGDVSVRDRKNQQKQYDLTVNLIGSLSSEQTPFKTDKEFALYYLLRRIKALGLASNKSGVHMSGAFIRKKTERESLLKDLLSNSLIEEVQIEGLNEIYYIPKDADKIDVEIQDKVTFIAPLDNLIWDRNLIHDVFDFYYRWEVYTPLKKRVYGYYVLPILYKSDIVGRIEFDKHRGKEPLTIKNIWLEEHIKKTKKLDQKIQQAINRFTKYVKANRKEI